jgi:hypothetical protein
MRTRGVPHASVRLAIDHLVRCGLVVEAGKGVT